MEHSMSARNRIKSTRIFAVAASLAFALPAFAADYSCDGAVTGVTVNGSGIVSAANAGGQSWGYFCQLGQTTNGVTPEACKGMLAILLAAQSSGKGVRIWYRDSASCSTYRGWNWLDTMYWGPTLID
jgi:hypothetical protein